MIEIAMPVVALKTKGAIFTQPLYVATIEYRAWTDDGGPRHPSFKGIAKATEETGVSEVVENTE